MFKAPKKVIGEMKKLQRRFLWGGEEEKKKMAWVSWETVCKPEHLGGLGVKDLEVFNIALMEKWRWRLLSEDDSPLWKKILCFRYGNVCSWNGELPSYNIVKKSSLWWRDLVILGDGLNIGSSWFNSVAKLKLGNGTKIKFWYDKWIGTESLAYLFPSVVEVCDRKDYTVAEMGSWRDSGWTWDWSWITPEEEFDTDAVNGLMELLNGIQLQQNVSDRFIWLPDTMRGFTVKSCYEWLSNSRSGTALV